MFMGKETETELIQVIHDDMDGKQWSSSQVKKKNKKNMVE